MRKLYLYHIPIKGFYLGSWLDVIAESKQHAVELGKIALAERGLEDYADDDANWSEIKYDGITRRDIEPGVVNLITGDY